MDVRIAMCITKSVLDFVMDFSSPGQDDAW